MKKIIVLISLLLFGYTWAEENIQVTEAVKTKPFIGLWTPFFLNFFLPFGIGSFVQGDKKAGAAILVLDILGIAATTFAVVIQVDRDSSFRLFSENISLKDRYALYIANIAIASVLLTISRVLAIVMPFAYYKKHLSYLPTLEVQEEIANNQIAGIGLLLKWKRTF